MVVFGLCIFKQKEKRREDSCDFILYYIILMSAICDELILNNFLDTALKVILYFARPTKYF